MNAKYIYLFLILFLQFSCFNFLNSNNDLIGPKFEYDCAQILPKLWPEDILYQNIQIYIAGNEANLRLNDKEITLRSGELDIVTSDYVIECKASKNLDDSKSIKQFLKERNLLEWMGILHQEIQHKKARIFLKKSTKNFNLEINSNSTFNKPVILTTNKTKYTNSPDEALEIWLNIIKTLANKQLLIFLKNTPTDFSFISKLKHNNLLDQTYIIDIDLESITSLKILAEKLYPNINHNFMAMLTEELNKFELATRSA